MLEADFAVLLEVREAVTKALEEARGAGLVKKSQEAAIVVAVPADVLTVTSKYTAADFEELFIVSGVTFVEGDELSVEIQQATGEKCPRCWNYRELGGNPAHPLVCKRCGDVLDAIGYTEEG